MKTKYIALVICLMTSVSLFAQPGFDPNVNDTAPIPGLLIALGAAIGIGVVKLRSKK